MESSFKLFRYRGIQIGANWSWILVLAVIVWALAQELFPSAYPDLSQGTYLAMAVVAAVVFFASLLLHELGHALRALKEGMEIDGITLWFFGGVARFKGTFPSAGAEFRIAIAGPVVTLVITLLFAGLTALLNAVDAPAQVVGVTAYLRFINALLLVFNLVPALPLDGGRVLRSYLWHRHADFTSATLSAAKAGRAFGGVLIGAGILLLFTGGGLGGLQLSLLGWFLLQAAQAEASFAEFRYALRDLKVSDVMSPDPITVTPKTTIEKFMAQLAHARSHSAYPVLERRKLVGLVSLRLAARVPEAERASRTVADIMLPADQVPTLEGDAEVTEAILAIQEPPGRAVVMAGTRVVGVLTSSDIARAIEVERIRTPKPAVRAGRVPIVVWVVFVAVVVVGAGYFYSPPVAIIAPGKSFDVSGDIQISGRDGEVNGKYLLTSVSVQRPNGLGLAWAMLRSDDIVAINNVIPQDIDPDQFFDAQRALFKERQMVAAAAAAKAAGLEVGLEGTGARVQAVVRGSPADERLRAEDVITAVDGSPIRLSTELGRIIQSRPAGTVFRLTVERGDASEVVEVRSRGGIIEGRPGIGVQVDTRDFDINLPFEVSFIERDIGGPSAGITYALAVYDLLAEEDLARGRAIASTGEIDLDGRVGVVGGVGDKAVAADRAGAELFLVPNEEVTAARGAGLDVQGVATLMEAIQFLRGSR